MGDIKSHRIGDRVLFTSEDYFKKEENANKYVNHFCIVKAIDLRAETVQIEFPDGFKKWVKASRISEAFEFCED
jgi:hypothetical protein